MDITQVIGIAAGVFTSVSLLPQLIKMIKEKKADDVSLVMLLVLLTGLSLWVIYGIMKKDYPIIITNSFSVLVNFFVVVLRIKYSGVKA